MITAEDRAALLDGLSPSSTELSRTLGRYHLLRQLGAGAMGQVYEAFDPELGRKVAVKVLRQDAEAAILAEQSERARALLVAEAKCLARLAHPNVVPIFDVGECADGTIYLAMELVVGRSLRALLETRRKDRRALLEWIVQAGRGLHAAHASGLVHRDFKPENVMVGNDGRVFVLDFGLALDMQVIALGHEGLSTPGFSGSGTPAYMAPEQTRGESCIASGDIFAFSCVVYEAWCGVRPFVSQPIDQRLAAIAAHEFSWPWGTPEWLREAVGQGLQGDPLQRTSSLQTMLDRLTDGLQRLHWQYTFWPRMGIAMVSLAALGTFVVYNDTKERCTTVAQPLASVWDVARRDELSQAFGQVAGSQGLAVAGRVAAEIEAWRAQWIDRSSFVCEGNWQPAQAGLSLRELEGARACLNESRAQVQGLLEVWRQPSREQVLQATSALRTLASPDDCTRPEHLATRAPLPIDPTQRQAVLHLRVLFKALAVRIEQGDRARAKSELLHARDVVLATADAPLLAEYFWELGRLAERSAGATSTRLLPLRQASLWEIAGNRPELLASSIQYQWFVEVYHLNHGEASDDLLGQQHAAVQRAGASAALLSGLTRNRGIAATLQGELGPARLYFEASLRHAQVAAGEVADSTSAALYDLAFVCLMVGDFVAAQNNLRRSIAILMELYGPNHPDTLATRDLLGTVLLRVGALDEAIAVHQRALGDCLTANLGDEHCAEGFLHAAHSLREAGYFAAATQAHQRLIVLQDRVGRRIEATAPYAESELAVVLLHRGDLAGARVLARQGLDRLLHDESFPASAHAAARLAVLRVALADEEWSTVAEELRQLAVILQSPSEGRDEILPQLAGFSGALAHHLGQRPTALEHYERAVVEAWSAKLAPQHLLVYYEDWSQALMAAGFLELASEAHGEALRLASQSEGLAPGVAVELDYRSGELAWARGDWFAAHDAYLRAAQAFDTTEVIEPRKAPILFGQARVLWYLDPSPAGRTQALHLARVAEDFLRRSPFSVRKELAEVRMWIASHRLDR